MRRLSNTISVTVKIEIFKRIKDEIIKEAPMYSTELEGRQSFKEKD